MRSIKANQITDIVEKLCIEANYNLNPDIMRGFTESLEREESPLGKEILQALIENAHIACNDQTAICQDTGMAVVFVELGQEVLVEGGSLEGAINEGVRRGYENGYLRKSVVRDPIDRVNTNDNTPAVIHYTVRDGNKIKITIAPKGFGSENMSSLRMLKPSHGIEGVMDFVVETVRAAGGNPCPPIIVGIGVGGTMEKAALLAKRALLRPVGSTHPTVFWQERERELLGRINSLRIGPSGLGGSTTALAVHIETYPTHIAGLPVAVNIGCHVTRHAEAEL